MWIEIFKAGTHTAANGKTITFTPEDVQGICKKYNEQTDHEAPLVLGHPTDNGPAYGWVRELKVAGDKMLAYIDTVSDKVRAAVDAKMFKKVSISLYPDNLLRHVGLLGAAPPAVKGLAPVQFKEGDDFLEFTSEEDRLTSILGKLESFFRKTQPKEDPMEMKELMEKHEKLSTDYTKLSGDFAEAVKKIETLTASFTEYKTEAAKKDLDRDIEIRKVRLEGEKKAFSEFLEGLIKEEKVLAAERDALLSEFDDIYTANSRLEFKEGEKSLILKFRERLTARPSHKTPPGHQFTQGRASVVDPKDIPSDFANVTVASDGLVIDRMIQDYMEKNKCSYEQAAMAIGG